MKSLLTLAVILLTLHTLPAQTCDEMLMAAQQYESQGRYFDAYQKYDAALTRCGDAQKEAIEKRSWLQSGIQVYRAMVDRSRLNGRT